MLSPHATKNPFALLESPRSERQVLQLQDLGSDVHDKCDDTNNDTEDVDDIVPIALHVARATARKTPLLVGLDSTGEGLRDKRASQLGLELGIARVAGGCGEGIDHAKNKEAGESAAQVGNAEMYSLSVCWLADNIL